MFPHFWQELKWVFSRYNLNFPSSPCWQCSRKECHHTASKIFFQHQNNINIEIYFFTISLQKNGQPWHSISQESESLDARTVATFFIFGALGLTGLLVTGLFQNCLVNPQSTYICRVQSSVWRLPQYWPPTPLSAQRVGPPPPHHRGGGGGYALAGRWGGGGSITSCIGILQYNLCTSKSASHCFFFSWHSHPLEFWCLKVLSSGNWGGSKLVSIEPQWKSVLPASVVYHAPRDTITRGALKFLAAVVLFDAIPTGWVSNHNSVGLIMLQRRYSDAVAL